MNWKLMEISPKNGRKCSQKNGNFQWILFLKIVCHEWRKWPQNWKWPKIAEKCWKVPFCNGGVHHNPHRFDTCVFEKVPFCLQRPDFCHIWTKFDIFDQFGPNSQVRVCKWKFWPIYLNFELKMTNFSPENQLWAKTEMLSKKSRKLWPKLNRKI